MLTITINLNSTQFTPDAGLYSLASDQITVVVAGRYLISYQCTLKVSTGTSRSQVDCWLENNTVQMVGTRSSQYMRQQGFGGSGGATIVEDLSASDVVRMRAQRLQGTSTISPIMNGSRLTIVRLT